MRSQKKCVGLTGKSGERGRNRTFNLVIKSQQSQAYAVDFTLASWVYGGGLRGSGRLWCTLLCTPTRLTISLLLPLESSRWFLDGLFQTMFARGRP